MAVGPDGNVGGVVVEVGLDTVEVGLDTVENLKIEKMILASTNSAGLEKN